MEQQERQARSRPWEEQKVDLTPIDNLKKASLNSNNSEEASPNSNNLKEANPNFDIDLL
jgi:hypothetical protein